MKQTEHSPAAEAPQPRKRQAALDRGVLALGVAIAAIVLFIGNGASALPQALRKLAGLGLGPNHLLVNALLLNVALLIFGWRRYDELCVEVRERREAEAQARQLADIDPLTGCLNRRSIAEATNRLIATARAHGEAVAFLMIDLDNFKQINDFNGHMVGDRVLETCASRIRALMPREALVARLGGDEFACVVPYNPAETDRVDRLASGIINAIATPFTIDSFHGEVTVSLGVVSTDRAAAKADAAALMHRADIAMYQAKKQGRNRHLWFEEPMEAELRQRSELECGIRAGIARGEFVPYYEQQIDLDSGRLVGFEMLARWHSPQFGVVKPEIFIPIAEEIGVIGEMSERLIAQALVDAAEWDAALKLSVNISAVQLRDPWFAQKLLRLLVAANFPPSRLDIEITESSLHDNIAGVHALITSLKNQGVGISLDDFGTGYSSLAQLRDLPFDRIKIDRSFISSLRDAGESQTIVETITALGRGLGLPITAEGVENEFVLAKLREMGRFNGQGYLYGRPQPAAATHDLLAARNLLAPPAEVETDARPPASARRSA